MTGEEKNMRLQTVRTKFFCLAMTVLGLELAFFSQSVLSQAPTQTVAGKKVKVGVIIPLTGAFARYGQKIQAAIQALPTTDLEYIFEDEGCDPKTAVRSYNKLSQIDGVKIFLGPWCGSPQSAVSPLLKSAKHIAISGSSLSETLFEISGGRMYSTQHSIETEAKFTAEHLNAQGVQSVSIVFFENAFSRAHEAAFRSAFKGKVLETFAYTSGAISELRSIALKIRQQKPEALYIPDAFPLMGGFIKELSAAGLKEIPYYSPYSAQSDDVKTVLGKAGERLYYSYPKIGENDALDYFPTLAAKIITDAAKVCGEDIDCLQKEISTKNNFDKYGVLVGELELRTIRDGKFVPTASK